MLDNLPSEHSLGEQDLGDVVPAEAAQSTRWASAASLGRLGAVRWGVGIVVGVIVIGKEELFGLTTSKTMAPEAPPPGVLTVTLNVSHAVLPPIVGVICAVSSLELT